MFHTAINTILHTMHHSRVAWWHNGRTLDLWLWWCGFSYWTLHCINLRQIRLHLGVVVCFGTSTGAKNAWVCQVCALSQDVWDTVHIVVHVQSPHRESGGWSHPETEALSLHAWLTQARTLFRKSMFYKQEFSKQITKYFDGVCSHMQTYM